MAGIKFDTEGNLTDEGTRGGIDNTWAHIAA
jgi:hypothetical protein